MKFENLQILNIHYFLLNTFTKYSRNICHFNRFFLPKIQSIILENSFILPQIMLKNFAQFFSHIPMFQQYPAKNLTKTNFYICIKKNKDVITSVTIVINVGIINLCHFVKL